MSCYTIYYQDGAKRMRPVLNRQEYMALRDSEENRRAEKRRMVQMNYSCLPNEDGTLRGSKQMSNTVGMDVDVPIDTDFVLSKKEELGLLMFENSATKPGCGHIVFRRRPELTQEENLRWASKVLGVEYDQGAKDITRVFYTPADKLIYLDDALFEQEAAEPSDPSPALPREGGEKSAMQTDNAPKENADTTSANIGDHKTPSLGRAGEGSEAGERLYDGIPYSTIVSKYWELFNDGKEPQQGDRNVKTYELAMTIRHICDYDQQMLEQIIPRYDGFDEAEWRQTIRNAVNEPRKSAPYRLKQLLRAVKEERKMALFSGGLDALPLGGAVEGSGAGEGSLPQRPKRMPEMLKLLSSKVPMKLKAMVEESVWPAMCAHLHGVTFRYVDGVIHEANICSPLIGRQSTGKGHVNLPIECLLADITAADEQNKQREQEWRRRNQGKGASKDRQPRPEDIVIQRLDDDLTPAALSQSLIDAERNGQRRIITKVDEIELLNKVGNGRNDTVGLLVRYGFDTARWGQRRVGLDSVNGSYTVRWVWNASCTLKSARKFITNDWIANGSLSRLNVNALLLPKDDHALPKIGEYDEKFQADLKLYVDRLNAASGLVECPQANKLALEMIAEHERIADLCESDGYRTFSYRAIVIGWLKANILYIAHGYKWDKTVAEYVRYSVRRDMWLKMYFFGQQIEEEFEEEERQQQHGPKNLLSSLPEEFTLDDYLRMRQAQGKHGDGRSTLRTWKTRGYVDYDEVTETWRKLKTTL